MKTVYLAGPMGGLTFAEANDWREYVDDYLHQSGILTLSPTRWLQGMSPNRVIGTAGGQEMDILKRTMGTDDPKMPVIQDLRDIDRSDFVLALLDNVPSNSHGIGTAMEISYAFARGIPIIGVGELSGPFKHVFVEHMITEHVLSLKDAVNVIRYATTLRRTKPCK